MNRKQKASLVEAINELVADGLLLVWDPNNKQLHSGVDDVAGASMNGLAVQVSLVQRTRAKLIAVKVGCLADGKGTGAYQAFVEQEDGSYRAAQDFENSPAPIEKVWERINRQS